MECIADVKAVLGEGPVWVAREQALYWVDIPEKRLFRWSEAEGLRERELADHLCSLAPRASGGFIGAGYDGFLAIDLETRQALHLGDPEPELDTNRFNDGKVDREGRFWAGTMDRFEREVTGALYRLDADLKWTCIDSGYRVTNGPAFSLDGRTMYHSDSALQRVYVFDLAGDGSATDRRIHAQFERGEGYPDGMTVDAEDCLWIAFWDGWCVRRLSPAGERLQELRLPVQRPTSCAFGGAALDRLFITSASRGLTPTEMEGQPSAGGLFMATPGVTGVAEPLFAG
ncbi:MAG: xylono,5-lactonase [Sphingomonadales bacterium]|jgi:sugar lactone lactonase YvrE|nr:xylono,5-lactonase [Sphingomonadales bacterium]MEA3045338.1 xylono,5-lactonase [Sphingomonadales bacterium]